MIHVYPACFYKEKEGGYSVIFPDLNHLATCGDTLEQAVTMAVDCLAGYIHYAKREGNLLPEPSERGSVNPDAEYDDYEEVFVNMVAVDAEEYAKSHFERSIRKNLTIPKWLNDTALREGVNFSRVLQNALLEQLNLPRTNRR
jgi:predicted RNase H-like HicB family nuclease